MKSRIVGHRFLKQASNRVRREWIDLFETTPLCANFLTTVAFSKRVRD